MQFKKSVQKTGNISCVCIKEVSWDGAEGKSFSFYVLSYLLNFKQCESIKYPKKFKMFK